MIDSPPRRPPVAVRVDQDAIHVVIAHRSGTPTRERWAWSEIAAWARAKGDANSSAGVTLLLRVAPGFTWIPSGAEGYGGFMAALTVREVPELSADELGALAERARLAMVRERLGALAPEAREQIEAIFAESQATASGRVQLAILSLADSDVGKVREMANHAKRDWRDVVVWADERGYRPPPKH